MCNNFLRSTYGWWIAYLLPEKTPTFFDSTPQRVGYNGDYLLGHWTPLKVVVDKSQAPEDAKKNPIYRIEIDLKFFERWKHNRNLFY